MKFVDFYSNWEHIFESISCEFKSFSITSPELSENDAVFLM